MKIFGIGLNKTGTASLHRAFGLLGLRSLHWAPHHDDSNWRVRESQRINVGLKERLNSGDRDVLGEWADFDAYSDIHAIIDNFEVFDRCYPGSRFIYTERDDESWVRSRIAHIRKNRERKAQGEYSGAYLRIDPDDWLVAKHEHRDRVDRYFGGTRKRDLLVFNLFRGDGFEPLCEFLGLDLPDCAFPWVNRSKKQ